MSEILIFGVSGDQLTDDCCHSLEKCCAVVVSKRFESLLVGFSGRRIPIAPVKKMVKAVADALDSGDVVILASGDPLFFGVGRTMIDRFGPDRVRIFPALSAVQLACARFKIPWDDLTLLSLHGRAAGNLAGRILPHSRVMLFTDHHNSPSMVAGLLLHALEEYGDEQRIKKIRVRVAENLGSHDEKISCGGLAEIAAATFGGLNMMLIEQDLQELTGPVFGLQEREIAHSRGLITKDEVRAVVLHCLRLPTRGIFWDVGGGSGSISIEAARLSPGLDIYTVEKKNEEQDNIRNNVVRYNLYNIHLIAGRAPEQLISLPDPDRIFIGGSDGSLAGIIDHAADRLPAGGRLVASAVLKKTADQAPVLMAEKGLKVDVRTIVVTRQARKGVRSSFDLYDKGHFHPIKVKRRPDPFPDPFPEVQLNPITIITGRK